MTVAFTSPTTGVIRSLGDQSIKLSAVLNNRAPVTKDAASGAEGVTVAAPNEVPQFPPLNLRVETVSLAGAASRIDSVGIGAAQVGNIIGQLQSIALRASSAGLSESEREILRAQFHALAQSVGSVPPAPAEKVDVKSVLADLGDAAPTLAADAPTKLGFTGKELFGDANVDTAEAASQAVETLKSASVVVEGQRAIIGQIKDAADFASASVEAALQNQEALRSTLTPDDIAGKSGASLIDALRAQSEKATIAQTSRLPNDVLKLIS